MEKELKKEKINRPVPKVGITIGDVNGISPEVIMKALADQRILLDCIPVIYASAKVFSYHRRLNKINDFSFNSCKSVEDIRNKKINIVNIWKEEIVFNIGEATKEGGRYALESLERATTDLASGKIDVLVTAPIHKEAMKKAGFKFPGHTEYLASLAHQEEALMMMVYDRLKVALATTHLSLKEVPEALSKDRIIHKIKALNQSLQKDFLIKKPKIAVLGLNPHAGENGEMGKEEKEIIEPAIEFLKNEEDILVFGSYPADGFFGSSAPFKFDGVSAIYHYHGLTGFKAIAFDEGVNFTAGLPIIRTSPDHGTAYDIVGKNKASGASMRNAIYLAIDIYRNHLFEKEASSNPLPFGVDAK